MSKNKLIVGNWKMNPQTLSEAKEIVKKCKSVSAHLNKTSVVVCPPSVFVGGLAASDSANFSLGAQDVSFYESGSHTGEISPTMLKNSGVQYVILGHSERRVMGESDELVSKKVNAVLDAGMIPIVCVGEKTRDESMMHYEFVRDQIKASLNNIPKSKSGHIILAYEPVWAIGAKEAMDPSHILEMNLFVKKGFADIFGNSSGLNVKVLYGGSVNSKNAGEIIRVGEVDGLLVGRESVSVDGFAELLKAVDEVGNK